LTTIDSGANMKEQITDWDKLFEALDIPHFSALREVFVPWCVWPKTKWADQTIKCTFASSSTRTESCEIANNVWVKWAEILLPRVEWCPRLKSSRCH
jgi:hypothetical protein